jgi:hypothetical protein
MSDGALLKIDRATKHISELSELFEKERPFTYVVETNTNTRRRSTFAKENKSVINRAALMCGDSIHNIRSALDHAYWSVVSPFATNDRERRSVQFPFSESAARLDESIKNRLANRASDTFFKALLALKPHGEAGGNELLYLIHRLDVVDKHMLLIPTADYKRITSFIIQKQVPDFPSGMFYGGFGQNGRDVEWPMSPTQPIPIGALAVFEQELDVPVDVVFQTTETGDVRHVVPTLHQLVDVAKKTIHIMRSA